ncbi:hypothetical protein [Consotaella aegiceratis]|uniref:hypothetical protein n=1 Tax=Consotaella aegiceratis TaxID=3097961 RepID=UPI002F41BA0B
MAFSKKAVVGAVLASFVAFPALAVAVPGPNTTDNVQLQSDATPIELAAIPLPTPRPVAMKATAEIRRTDDGIRMVGPRFFPDH